MKLDNDIQYRPRYNVKPTMGGQGANDFYKRKGGAHTPRKFKAYGGECRKTARQILDEEAEIFEEAIFETNG